MSALWIHLEMYPLFISPVFRSFGKMVEMCSQPQRSQQTGVGGRGGEVAKIPCVRPNRPSDFCSSGEKKTEQAIIHAFNPS